MRGWVSVRGHVIKPLILEVDFNLKKILRRIELPNDVISLRDIPSSKLGTTGLFLKGDYLFVGVWDGVVVVHKESLKIEEVYSSKEFSDVHGLYVDSKNRIWLTSTNLDGVYIIDDGKIKTFWHAWKYNRLTSHLLIDSSKDYRKLVKEESVFHHFHVNGLCVSNNYIAVSFLGSAPDESRILRVIKRVIGLKSFKRKGGVFIVQKADRKLKKILWTEGLHDPVVLDDNILVAPEYFGNAIIKINLEKMRVIDRIELNLNEEGYLSRGVCYCHHRYWVGHTVHRGWYKKNPCALVRSYDEKGYWTGDEIRMDGFVGVYQIVFEDDR